MNSIKAPDTPLTRRFAELRTAQQSRRISTQQILFSDPSSNSAFQTPVAAHRNHTENPDLPEKPARARSTPSLFPEIYDVNDPEIIIDPDMPPGDVPVAFNELVIDNMLTGSSRTATYSSQEICSSLLATAIVPTLISKLKSVKDVSGVPAFFDMYQSKVSSKSTNPTILNDLDTSGDVLRSKLRLFTTTIKNEYHAINYPEFISQLVIQGLVRSQHAEILVPQIHKYMIIQDTDAILQFEDRCAVGLPAEISIDFSLSAAELPGYSRLQSDPSEWIRLATALVDYASFMTNSEIQSAYSTSKHQLAAIRLEDCDSVRKFADLEEKLFNSFDTYARSTDRSSLDLLDRGIQILQQLPTHLRKEIDSHSRKYGIPENVMSRDWVISQLLRLEKREKADFSFWKKTIPRAPAPAPAPAPQQNPAPPSQDPANNIPPADDEMEITCIAQLVSDCEKTFKTSAKYWASKGWDLPKSCTACRKEKRRLAPASLMTQDQDHDTKTDSDVDDDVLVSYYEQM